MSTNAQVQFFGDLLLNKKLISSDQLAKIEEELSQNPLSKPEDFERILLGKGIITEENLLKVYSEYLGIPFTQVDQLSFDPHIISLIPAKFANKNKLIAIKKKDNVLTVALRYPFDINVTDELKTFTKFTIAPVIGTLGSIEQAIKSHYGTGAETVESLVQDSQVILNEFAIERLGDAENLEEMARDASMVNYVNQILLEAYQKRATDIHIEPFKDSLRIRYRIDGLLYEAQTPPEINKLHVAIISRLKVMANLNISERRRPQDGRCKINIKGQDLDLRLATYPSLFGEGMSIRLLSGGADLIKLEQLELSKEHQQTIEGFLKKPNGIILVTGPTGSGKTTTLYAFLNHINETSIKIVTLEDPIEYQIDGVNQIQTNPKVDLTFATGFRSILRQDPDVILVGEIRDPETAQIAIRAALTGHLILSTLHTNNALATIARLLDLGIEPYLLTSTLKAVIAQRLVRRICAKCKEKHSPPKEVLKALEIKSSKGPFYQGKGCDDCNDTGYKGRLALVELLTIDQKIGALISSGDTRGELKKQAEVAGMATLKSDGIQKALDGLTTLEEVVRVTE